MRASVLVIAPRTAGSALWLATLALRANCRMKKNEREPRWIFSAKAMKGMEVGQ